MNFAVLDVSCGFTPAFEALDTVNSFAGVSTIASIMPTRYLDDTFDTSDRGTAFADRYVANPYSSIAAQWADALNGTTGGVSCNWGGGGHGIFGCGVYLAISVEVNASLATWANRTENWIQVRNDANDATGVGYFVSILNCNYDCVRYPIVL